MKLQTYKQNGSSELQIAVLKAICGNTTGKALIDLCCGSAPQTSQLTFRSKTYVDAVDRKLPDGNVVVGNVIDFLQNTNEFWDISISTDSIEHFRDNDAINFLSLTSQRAKKNIWFTPLGEFCITHNPENNDPDTHKSEWTPEKLESLYPGKWSFLVFPYWHPTLRNSKNEILGAFFFWNANDIDNTDYQRVIEELKVFE